MSVWVYLRRVDRTGHQDWCSDVGLVDQRISVRPILQSLTLYGTIRKTGCDQIGMRTDPEESNSRVAQKRMLEQIVAIPATLYLPSSIVAELNEICETLGYTPKQLVIEALRGQIEYWNEFYEYSTTLPVEPQDLGWPEDPVFCLACVTIAHIISNFARCSHDPVAFAQLKADAPTEWSFNSLEEGEEIDEADWWKTFP